MEKEQALEEVEFRYPFERYRLNDILKVSDAVRIIESNHGHSIIMEVNGNYYKNWYDNKHLQTIMYLKFLGDEANDFELKRHQLHSIGFDSPDSSLYVNHVIDKVNETIIDNLNNNQRTFPINILEALGQEEKISDYNDSLYGVIKLIMNDLGYKTVPGYSDKIERTSFPVDDLSNIASEVLEIFVFPLKTKNKSKQLKMNK
ncbi:MAG: hypothetical protein PHO63_03840 [Bacilli bacterium]|nr:hypothetical protein [Bacilli bacterium]MDD4809469.1 hypothetical protein [Bacilli bacterium]